MEETEVTYSVGWSVYLKASRQIRLEKHKEDSSRPE